MKRNPGKFETLDLYRALARQEGYKFSNPESSIGFIQRLESEFTKARSNPITLHGVRTQTMFEYVAASLGRCAVIKTEDSGEIYVDTSNLELPDYRILLLDGQEILVEVKNFYQKRSLEPYTFNKSYMNGLIKYASLFKRDLKLAIYWSRWNTWTLNPTSIAKPRGSKYVLSFEDAHKYNEMYLLGDLMVATTPPIVLRIATDINKPRAVHPNGGVNFTIASIDFYCEDRQITDSFEKSLAFYFMMFGKWEVSDGDAEIVDSQLVAVQYVAEPDERVPEQGFEILGTMSGMISKYFDYLTAPEGSVERLSPDSEGIALGLMIPEDYKGKALPLWRFIQRPTKE